MHCVQTLRVRPMTEAELEAFREREIGFEPTAMQMHNALGGATR